jgi:hypothetical protein
VDARSRLRFVVEVAIAATAALLAMVTVVWPDWIELVFGADPDHGSGSLEWAVVAALVVVAGVLTLSARRTWRTHAPQPA